MKDLSNEKLCEEIRSGSAAALEQLVVRNTNLLYSLMKRFRYESGEKEDLFSCAKIGLIKAAKNFDPAFQCQFSTYAVPLILGEIKKYFRDNSALHVARSYKDLYRIVMKAQETLEMEHQRSVSLYEVADYLDLSPEEVLFAYESHASSPSLDAPLKEDEDLCLIDTIGKPDDSEIDRDLKMAMEKLDKRERLIIELRYFEGFTQEEIAKRLFLSQVQISRLEKKILEKLKTYIS